MNKHINNFFSLENTKHRTPLIRKNFVSKKQSNFIQKKRPVIIIPARYHSSRLPGKPLKDIEGKSMLNRTYKKCIEVLPKQDVYVATDSLIIQKHCQDFDANVLMTSSSCLTGTDRIAEACNYIKCDVIINVQGDEPIINPEDIRKVIDAAIKYPGQIINGMATIETEDQFFNPNIPKVVTRPDGKLLYMTRAAIPTTKSLKFEMAWKQICIYAFPVDCLKSFAQQKNKTPLEQIEDIEILRFLEMSYDVRMIALSGSSFAIDTPEDLEKIREQLKKDKTP